MGKETDKGPKDPGRRKVIFDCLWGLGILASGGICLSQLEKRGSEENPNSLGQRDGHTNPEQGLPQIKTESISSGDQEFQTLTFPNPLFSGVSTRVVDATLAQALVGRETQSKTMGIKSLVVHHTACENCFQKNQLLDINRLITTSQVKVAPPYNAVIAKNGDIFFLCSLDSISGSLRDTQNELLNTQTYSIALDGNFEENETSTTQRQSLQFLIYFLYHAFGLDKSGGINGRGGIILGHNEAPNQSTLCPGKNLLPKYLGPNENRTKEVANMVGWSIARGKFQGIDQENLVRLIFQKMENVYPQIFGKDFDQNANLDKEVFRFLLSLSLSESSLRTSDNGLPILRPNINNTFWEQTTFDCGPFQLNSKYALGDNPVAAIRASLDIDYSVEQGVRIALEKLRRAKFDWTEAALNYKGIYQRLAANEVHQQMFSITLKNTDHRLRVHLPQIKKEITIHYKTDRHLTIN